MLYSFHAQPISAVDKRRSSFELADKVSKVLGLSIVVKLLHRPFGNNARFVSIHNQLIALEFLRIDCAGLFGLEKRGKGA